MAKTQTRQEPRRRLPRPYPLVNRSARATLYSAQPAYPADQSGCELRVRGRRSERTRILTVPYAREGGDIVVAPGGSAGGAWWRNFTDPYPVEVRLGAEWQPGIGRLVPAGHPGRPAAVRTYRARFPHVHPSAADPLLVITLLPTAGNG